MITLTTWLFALTLDDVVNAHVKARALRCSFTSEKKAKVFKQPIRSAGVVTVARGGKLRLETKAGDRSTLLLVDEDSVRHVRDGHIEVQPVSALGAARAFVAAFGNGLFGDLDGLRRDWTLTPKPRDHDLVVDLVPLKGGTLARVTLTFGADAAVSQLHLVEQSGDATSYTFTGCVRDPAVSDDLFKKP